MTSHMGEKDGHTRGPWVVGNTDPLLFGCPRGNGTEPIGFVYGPSFPENSAVGRRALADARLAAAAPELLEVLARYVQQDLAQGLTDNNLHRTARAAIAKATGSQS